MSITKEGIEGEKLARDILKQQGFSIFGGDWIAFKDSEYFLVEVKNKELFEPPPFLGTGLDIRQVITRKVFTERTGIKTIIFTRDKKTGICYWQFLDKLEEGSYHDTKNKIRIYPITSFESIHPIENGKEEKETTTN